MSNSPAKSSSPANSAVSAYTGNSVDFTLFELHSNVYKNLTSPIKPNTLITQATNIIKEYTSFLNAFIEPPTDLIKTTDLKFKPGYKQEESFFKLIHGIIIRANKPDNIDQDKAKAIIEQSKIIMTVIDSILLNKIINENNKPDIQDKTFSSVNPQSIEDLVMNSISTDIELTDTKSSEISSLISSISDYVNTPDMVGTTSGIKSIFDTFTPLIEAINTSIAAAAATAVASTPPATVLTLLNKIVILSVMTIPKLRTKIKDNLTPSTIIIKTGFFVVGGNIQCPTEPNKAFQNSDLTNMHVLKVNPFAVKTSLITAPLTNENLPELTSQICNPSPKHIYIVGNLYCVNGQLIPPNLDDIIGIYNEEPLPVLENNGITKLLTDDNTNIPYIRTQLKISEFCSSLESVASSHVVSKESSLQSQTASSFAKRPHQSSSESIKESPPKETERLEKLKAKEAKEAKDAKDAKEASDAKYYKNLKEKEAKEANDAKEAKEANDAKEANIKAKPKAKAKPKPGFGSATKRLGKGGGNKYTRKNNLVTNNSKTRKNYYDDYESDDKSANESNESMPE